MPKQIRQIAQCHMRTPKELTLIAEQTTPESLSHQFLFCPQPRARQEELLELIKQTQPKQCLIFANSRKEVEGLYRFLKPRLSQLDFLHGGLDQSVRAIITNKFTKGKIRYLIATDIAARGLDFSSITHVFNFHFPFELETYLHRSGRAGRSGREGVCVTLVTKRDMSSVKELLRILQREPVWLKRPPPC
jgi:ATP-dependent RNA helicase DeaD